MNMFQRRTTFGGGFNAVGALVQFAGYGAGLAIESLSAQYQQQLVRLWDLDGDAGSTYIVAGHPSGQAALNKVIGPRAIQDAFYEQYGDVCMAAENTLNFTAKTGCFGNTANKTAQASDTNTTQLALVMSGTVIGNVAVAVTANEPVMRQNMGLMFVSLDWSEAGNPAPSLQLNL